MYKLIKRTKTLLFPIGVALLIACTVGVPSNIIQPQEMEDLLYDYHLMQAMAGDLKSNEKYKRQLYEQYVFDKHHVDESLFDSSLAWYMRNTKELEAIYKNLNTRFSAQKEELATYIRPDERANRQAPTGDSVNIWEDYRLFRLSHAPLNNKVLFTLPADTTFYADDSFEWKLNARFLGDAEKKLQAVISLTTLTDKDTIGNSCLITSSGSYSLPLQCHPGHTPKELVGHIYYYPIHSDSINQDSIPDLLLSDITLMRYHSNKE